MSETIIIFFCGDANVRCDRDRHWGHRKAPRLFHLAKRGVKVLGLDRFAPGHDRGSSHGRTRIIRQAYFEHPDYVPLLLRAYELWGDLSQRIGKLLLHEIGLLQLGLPMERLFQEFVTQPRNIGWRSSTFRPPKCVGDSRLLPSIRIRSGFRAKGGYLDVEECVFAHLNEGKTSAQYYERTFRSGNGRRRR